MPEDRPVSSPNLVPSETAARAAYLYYVAELSQAEVAGRLGVSRATVFNLLSEARRTGLVRISLDADVLSRQDISSALKAKFGLTVAAVLPDADDPSGDVKMRGAAGMLEPMLPKGTQLGVAWGETIYGIAKVLPTARRPDVTIRQMVGSMASPHGFNAEDCSTLIASRLGASCVNLHAPAVLSDAALVNAITLEPVIKRQLDALSHCSAALFAVGLVSEGSHIVQSGVATRQDLEFYLAKGAAGVVAGRFIDAEGQPMSGPLDGRLIGAELEAISNIPLRFVVTFGQNRAAALHAALKGGLVSHLITDQTTASRIFDLES